MIRTRFAPSPTGYLHIGGVRTALFNWLFARQHGGQFILRIDDTDQQRNVQEALKPILDGLRWLGIDWDEGPEVGGPFAPYYQSQRLDRYQAAAQRLLASGHAYYDYATTTELQAEREAAEREKRQFRYSRRFKAETPADRARFESEGRQAVVRLKMPTAGTLVLDDLVRGRVEFDWAREQDHVVQRSDGTCLYHLANVVDDHDFEITHVIRAEEHLSNTPRQVFILEALGYPRPIYAHLPFVAEPGSRTKLSKRKLDKYLKNRDFAQMVEHGRKIAAAIGHPVEADAFNPVIVDFYQTVGYLPEAIINYLALLGWSLDDKAEHFSCRELIEKFSLERVNKAPASFDPKKLSAFEDWNFQQLPLERKVELTMPFLQKAGLIATPPTTEQRKTLEKVIAAAGDRIKVAGDILECDYFLQSNDEYKLHEELRRRHIPTRETAERLRDGRELIRSFGASADNLRLRRSFARLACATSNTTTTTLAPDYDPELTIAMLAEQIESGAVTVAAIEHSYRDYVLENAITMADIVHMVRVAITGKEKGLGLFDTIEILGKENAIARIDRALREAGHEELATPRATKMPESVREVFDFSDPTEPVVLHEGRLEIAHLNQSVAGSGRMSLLLAPKLEMTFSFEPASPAILHFSGEVELRIPELHFSAPAIITRSRITSEKGTELLEGVPSGRATVGGSDDIRRVVFHLTDFHDHIGKDVQNENGGRFRQGGMNLAARQWVITIHPVADLSERRKAFAQSGGVPVTHIGTLEREDGRPFANADCDRVIQFLHFFLSFVRGRLVAPLIPVGFDSEGKLIWQDWTLWRTATAPTFDSWCPVHSVEFVESLFPRFFERWMDPAWQDVLVRAINIYLHGNLQAMLDDSVICAQIIIEMIADFVLFEQAGAVPVVAPEGTTAQKINLLLQRASIPTEIPEKLAGLRTFAESEQLSSGLALVMRVRDACVHLNADGRHLLDRLEQQQKHGFYDVTRLALWYSDLCLLWLTGYEGRYQSRIHSEWVGETEAVPWAKPLEYPLEASANLR